MKRRSAVATLGAVFGYAIATPTLFSVLQSCKEAKPYDDWTPVFFEKDKGHALAQLVDILLPKTDTPSATEVNIHVFIDRFAKEVLPIEQQGFMNKLMDQFMAKALAQSGKTSLADVETAEWESLLSTYLAKRSKQEEKEQEEAIEAYMKTMMEGGEAVLDDEVSLYAFAGNLRDMTVWAYKNTEFVGEEVLAYLPIPGQYVPCGDVSELTGGKAWALSY